MIRGEFGESVLFVSIFRVLIAALIWVFGMRNDGQKPQGGVPRSGRTNGFIPSSFRAISSYLRIVSSGASTVASTVRSAASAAIVDRDNDASHDQVWF